MTIHEAASALGYRNPSAVRYLLRAGLLRGQKAPTAVRTHDGRTRVCNVWTTDADAVREFVRTRRRRGCPGVPKPHPPGCPCATHRARPKTHCAMMIPAEMRERLRVAAAKERQTVSEFARCALEWALEAVR